MSERYPGGFMTQSPPVPTATSTTGIWTLDQQEQLKQAGQWPPNGPFYIEEVFSAYTYTGNGATQTITNGIDLAGKGGLVWMKGRGAFSENNNLIDTVRGVTKSLSSNNTDSELTNSGAFSAFNANGFSLGPVNAIEINANARPYVSWTFRKQPKFFDIVTYTTVSGAMTIPHNLGSVPGCWIIKSYSAAGAAPDWWVTHRSIPSNVMRLNGASAVEAGFSTATSTNITISTGAYNPGTQIIIYIFAHDAGGFGLSGNENVISCGSYVGNSSIPAPVVTLGWEPQYVLIKAANASDPFYGDWFVFDTARGIFTSGTPDPRNNVVPDPSLKPNSFAGEGTTRQVLKLIGTGFQIESDSPTDLNQNGTTYIYIAIRNGPMKVPTLGTSVFSPVTRTGTSSAATVTGVGFPPTMMWSQYRNGAGNDNVLYDKLRGPVKTLFKNLTIAEQTPPSYGINSFDQNGVSLAGNQGYTNNAGTDFIYYFFQRATGFFDEVCYTGTGVAGQTFAHNLGVVPELMIVRKRNAVGEWCVYSAATGNTKSLFLQLTDAVNAGIIGYWNTTNPTSSVFSLGNNDEVNNSVGTYVAYLFATASGVSKVGSYTGTGTTQAIACGFTTGARFVLIKRTNSTGDWYFWDSARGITAGNDPYLLINNTAAEVTTTDYIDTSAAGFEISSTAPAAINAVGGSYIFLAIS